MQSESKSLRPGLGNHYRAGRLLLGVLQAGLLFALWHLWQTDGWLANRPVWFTPLCLLSLYLPWLAMASLGRIERRVLVRWLLLIAVLLVLLGIYDAWRGNMSDWLPLGESNDKRLPSLSLLMCTGVGLYIAQAMVQAGHVSRRYLAPYTAYFDQAWSLMVQGIFAAVFTSLFWTVINLGVALFLLIDVHQLEQLVSQAWCWIPLLTISFAFGMDMGDARAQIIGSIRRLLLILLCGLLPVAVLLMVGFLVSLAVSGPHLLWQTGFASPLMLCSGALLIVLINAVFQDGQQLVPRHWLVSLARLACFLPLPLVALAIYSLWLRVADYGWTSSRVAGAACMMVLLVYAIGYPIAALRRRQALTLIAPINVGASLFILVVLVGLFTPIADPVRLSVSSQVARLLAGKVKFAEFDYYFLSKESGRYGQQALQRLMALQQGEDAQEIALFAKQAANGEYHRGDKQPPAPDLSANLHMQTAAAQWSATPAPLPPRFVSHAWQQEANSWQLPNCMTNSGEKCDVWQIAPATGQGGGRLLVMHEREGPALFAEKRDGDWRFEGDLQLGAQCLDSLQKALKEGTLRWVNQTQQLPSINGIVLPLQLQAEVVYKC